MTALMRAARYSTPEVCRTLLDAGADASLKTKDGDTALMMMKAVRCNVPEIIELLEKEGGDNGRK